jgi:4-amino-4-deoxy-L-arabinose transferase-like glycosyltransferase
LTTLSQLTERVLERGARAYTAPLDLLSQGARVRAASALAGVLCVAFLLRVWAVGFGLPYLYHPDEPSKISAATGILKSGDPNPHYFKKPSLQIYLTTAAESVYYLAGKTLGWFSSVDDLPEPVILTGGVGRTDMPGVLVLSRLITVAFGVGSVYLMYLIGLRLSNDPWVGVLAAAMLAVCPSHVAFSKVVHPDALMLFFFLAVIYASIRIVREGRWQDYALAGLACGFAAGSKYNGFFAIVLPTLAHFLLARHVVQRDRLLALCYAMIAAGFLVTTPYAVITPGLFLGSVLFESLHYVNGHPGMEGQAPKWYLSYLLLYEGPIVLLAVVQLIRGYRQRSRDMVFLSIFPLAYFALIASLPVRNEQTLLPVMPFVYMFAAAGAVGFARWLVRRVPNLGTAGGIPIGAALALAITLVPASRSIAASYELGSIDSRETARLWIEANIPAGSNIVVESYSTFADPRRYKVRGERFLYIKPMQWYVGRGTEYVVFGERAYGRFFDERDRYKDEVAAYEELFRRFEFVQRLRDGGYEVLIYRVRATPAQDAHVQGATTSAHLERLPN